MSGLNVGGDWHRYHVDYLIEVSPDMSSGEDPKRGHYSNFGLIQFTSDGPSTIHNASKRELAQQEDHNYRVIAITTGPVEPPHYMDAAIHHHRGGGPYVHYLVPVAIRTWLDQFLTRQGYEAFESDEEGVFTVLTKDEVQALYVAESEAAVEALMEADDANID